MAPTYRWHRGFTFHFLCPTAQTPSASPSPAPKDTPHMFAPAKAQRPPLCSLGQTASWAAYSPFEALQSP